MLYLSRKEGEAVVIRTPEGDVVVKVLDLYDHTGAARVRLGCEAPRCVVIDRAEVRAAKRRTADAARTTA